MKKLEMNQMENLQGGQINGCDVALGTAVALWSTAFGVISLGAGFAIGLAGGLIVSEVCDG